MQMAEGAVVWPGGGGANKRHYSMQKFRFEWHIAHAKAFEKLICTVFIPDFRGFIKKIGKIGKWEP